MSHTSPAFGITLLCALLAPAPALAQGANQLENVATVELHLISEAGPKLLPRGTRVSLRVGERVTLLANGRDSTGQPAIDWEPSWPSGKTGFSIDARGSWAELRADAIGEYTLVVQVSGSSATTFVDLSIAPGDTGGIPPAGSVPPPVTTLPPQPVPPQQVPPQQVPPATGGPAARLELYLVQGGTTRVLQPGESVVGTIGNDYTLEVRAFDAGGLPASRFEPSWSPAPAGLTATSYGSSLRMRASAPGTYAMYVWPEGYPEATTSLVLVAHDSPSAPVSPHTLPPRGPAGGYRSEVHRLCSNLDVEYRRLLSAWQGRNDGEIQTSAQQIVSLGRQLDAQKPEGFLVLWHAPGMTEDARDILNELRDLNRQGRPSYGDIRNEINAMRTNCVDCHRTHNSSFIPAAVPRSLSTAKTVRK